MTTIKILKNRYGSFKEAKNALGIPAKGWADLIERLEQKSVKVEVDSLRGPKKNLKSANKKVRFSGRLSTPFGEFDFGYIAEAPAAIAEGLERLNGTYGQFNTQLGTLETLIETE